MKEIVTYSLNIMTLTYSLDIMTEKHILLMTYPLTPPLLYIVNT